MTRKLAECVQWGADGLCSQLKKGDWPEVGGRLYFAGWPIQSDLATGQPFLAAQLDRFAAALGLPLP